MKRIFFIVGFTACLPCLPAHATIGDTIAANGKTVYHAEGTVVTSFGTGYGQYCTVNQIQSTRLYDSNKAGPWTIPYYDGTEGDSLMCWSHVASNSIQYWQDVYGVFYKDTGNMQASGNDTARVLPNGYYSTTTASGYDSNGVYQTNAVVNNAQQLRIAEQFYYNWTNVAGKFRDAADWYFKWDSTTNPSSPGGYFSEYFGNGNSTRDAYVTIYCESMAQEYPQATSQGYTPFKDNDVNSLKEALLPGFGLTKQADGTYIQTEEGLIPSISIHDLNKGTGHVLSCQGFTTDAAGNLVSLLLADGDDGVTRLQEAYVIERDGYLKLYKDKEGTKPFYTNQDYFIYEVSYISTPDVLKNMLAEYRDPNEAAIWNGHAAQWYTQTDVVDSEIADSTTGWDIAVDGDNIAEQHHGYYHGYATDGRAVRFDDHAAADKRTVTITGTVSASHIEIAAYGYRFIAGENAALQAGADLTLNNGATLYSELPLHVNNLIMEGGTSLDSDSTIVVEGAFLVSIAQSTTFNLNEAAIPGVDIYTDLDLSLASAVILETSVNMHGQNLTLAFGQQITLQSTDADNPFISNIGTLTIGDEILPEGTDLSRYLVFVSPDNEEYSDMAFIYSNGSITATSVPEPTSSALGILALVACAVKRRRS